MPPQAAATTEICSSNAGTSSQIKCSTVPNRIKTEAMRNPRPFWRTRCINSIPNGSTAPTASAVIKTDIQPGLERFKNHDAFSGRSPYQATTKVMNSR